MHRFGCRLLLSAGQGLSPDTHAKPQRTQSIFVPFVRVSLHITGLICFYHPLYVASLGEMALCRCLPGFFLSVDCGWSCRGVCSDSYCLEKRIPCRGASGLALYLKLRLHFGYSENHFYALFLLFEPVLDFHLHRRWIRFGSFDA